MSGNRLEITCRIVVLLLVAVVHSPAQDEWKWPDKPANLQVLPKDWSGQRLSPVMKGFTRALGVRCTYCHVGEEGKPLTTYNFPSDANPNKDRAREMYRMLGDINAHLKKIQPGGDRRVNMWCSTCHRGRPKPMTLQEELGERYRAKGLEAALEHYDELKKKYYGRGALDFGEESLNDFGYELMGDSDLAGSIRVLKLNAEEFPASANVWDSLGEACMKAGDMKLAEQYYQKVLTLDPGSENAKQMLKKIKEAAGK
jgi:tetratricopeptide (TPR) repeat protein